MIQEMEWLNVPNPYIQYTHNPHPKLVKIILKHGFSFDDKYWYWMPKYRKSSLLVGIVKRSPLWTYPSKCIRAEKADKRNKRKYRNYGKKKVNK